MTTIELLGGTMLRRHGAPVTGPPAQRHRMALLALLAVSWPRAVPRERAADLLWPDSDAAAGRRLLNLAVHVLRRALGEGVIVSTADGLAFDAAGVSCDLHELRVALDRNDDEAAVRAWAGPLLDAFHLPDAPEFNMWLDGARESLARQYAAALQARAQRLEAVGDSAGRIDACRRLVALDPYSTAHTLALMRVLDDAGERAEALRCAAEHGRRLRDELEVDEDAAVADLVHSLRSSRNATPLLAVLSAPDALTGDDSAVADQLRDRLVEKLLDQPNVQLAADSPIAIRLVTAAGTRAPIDAAIELVARREGAGVVVTVRMVEPFRGTLLMSKRMGCAAATPAALDSVAAEAAAAIAGAVPRESGPARRPSGDDADAEEARILCARGLHFCGRREEASLRKGIACFERARAIDPSCAAAYTGLAGAYAVLGFYDLVAPREAFPLAKQAAHTARSLNPADPNSHASLGYIAEYFDWQWSSAERQLEHAIYIDPANPLAHQWLGNYLVARGRSRDAVDAMSRAVRFAPHSAIVLAATGWARYFAGDYEQAVDDFHASSELDPNLPVAQEWLGHTLQEMGRPDEAVAALRRACELSPTSTAFEAALAHSLAMAGGDDEARGILRRLTVKRRTSYVSAYEIAKTHLALGDAAKAVTWLEKAFHERSHSIALLRVDPQLRPLHDNLRFQDLARRAGHT